MDVDPPALEDAAGRGSIVVLERLCIRAVKTRRRSTQGVPNDQVLLAENAVQQQHAADRLLPRSSLLPQASLPSACDELTSCRELLCGRWAAQISHCREQHTNMEVSPRVRTAV
jgi:hypothetical protein